MCIGVFLWRSHPIYPLLLFLNRDEHHSRPTEALGWWDDGEIVGGRDMLAGGTWLGCSRRGRVAFLTNVRDLSSNPNATSRGHLPLLFLQSGKSPLEFGEEIAAVVCHYNGFNLVVADLCSKTMVYITNRPKSPHALVEEVSPGIHVLSNANLDSPWPKCVRLRENFTRVLKENEDGEFPMRKMVEEVMTDSVKDEEMKLPGVFAPEIEYHLSSIFVNVERPTGHYGTRSISALSVESSGSVCFYERHLENDAWKEHTEKFVIEKLKPSQAEAEAS